MEESDPMCGIAGIVGRSETDERRRMLDCIAHRGPDGEGEFADPGGLVWLGHRRLAIIDPECGQQPISNEDSSLRIVFNGCVYNYQEIAGQLRALGHRFRTHSDTEVVLHAYEQWGQDCVHRFNGMWAFAIWDSRQDTLFCSRDRIGVKPFYYFWDGKRLGLASEIKALFSMNGLTPEVDAGGLRQYLTFQFCLDEKTLFKSVKRLPPGHNLIVSAGKPPEVKAYWDLSFDIDEGFTEEKAIDRLRWMLEDSIRLRLRSDVPVGGHLSGGLDSSTIATLSTMMLHGTPLVTFTGFFPGHPAYDETRYSREVAREIRAENIEIPVTSTDFIDQFEKVIWHMDEPAAGPGVVPQYVVSREASRHVKVVLGGQGGDELFLGYARYLVAYLEECLKGAVRDTAERGQFVATLSSITPNLRLLQNYEPMLRSFWSNGLFESPDRRYFSLMNRIGTFRSIVSKDVDVNGDKSLAEFQRIFNHPSAASLINRIQYFDLKAHLQALLQVDDRTSMAWGLESRTPFLDYRLYETMAAIPPAVKFKGGRLKHLLLEISRHLLPSSVLQRKDKMGFPVPLTEWYRGPLKDYVRDTLLSKSCTERGIFEPRALEDALEREGAFGRAIWGALCLEKCIQTFVDGK